MWAYRTYLKLEINGQIGKACNRNWLEWNMHEHLKILLLRFFNYSAILDTDCNPFMNRKVTNRH